MQINARGCAAGLMTGMDGVNAVFDALAGLCGPALAARGLWLVPALMLAGLAGSVVHCTAMCGPFVLGQVADRMARVPAARLCEAARLRGGLLLPYHAGRLVTYTALGGLAGWLGGLHMPQLVPGLLLATAGAAFALLALRRRYPAWRWRGGIGWLGWPASGGPASGAARRASGFAGWAGAVLARGRGLPIGLALGLLPCAMVYAALAAAASGGAIIGGLAMLGFGLGTVPALVAVGVAGQAAGRRWHRATDRAAPLLLGANALVLAVLAWRALVA